MLELKKIAVTGGLACGKSSVCRIFNGLGAYVVSADTIVHESLSSDPVLIQGVVDLIGKEILVNNSIDRSRVSEIVFYDEELLKGLEKLVFPVVFDKIDKAYEEQKRGNSSATLFVAEVPLLFESGQAHRFDASVAVIASQEASFERFKTIAGNKENQFFAREKRQLPLLKKADLADYVLFNCGSLDDLQEITKQLYLELIE